MSGWRHPRHRSICFGFFVIFLGACATSNPEFSRHHGDPSIDLRAAPEKGGVATFVVKGLSPELLASFYDHGRGPAKVFAVRVRFQETETSQPTALPAIAGSYRVQGSMLVFQPAFDLRPGLVYRATLDLGGVVGSSPVKREFRIPSRPSAPSTTVTHVFPSADILPRNLLKFYIHFSAPMSRGLAFDHIRLLDEDGRQVAWPFLELDEELWDPGATRFTLFFDPGRIKRELKPNEDEGAPLRDGKTYTLVVSAQWRNARGESLKQSFEKKFRVGPVDYSQPDMETWHLTPPAAARRTAMIVESPESLDRALMERLIHVVGPDGEIVAGEVEISDGERRWSLTPDGAWQPGRYTLRVENTLEDLSGNSIGRPFEVDIFERVETRVELETVDRTFDVK